MMKKIFFLLAMVLLPLGVMALQVSIHAEPASPVSGEYFALRLQLDQQGTPRFAFPEVPGVSLLKNSVSTQINQQIINGKSDLAVSYIFQAVAERPGKYTIPAFKVTLNGQSAETSPLEIVVRDAAELAKLPVSDRITGVLKISPERKVYAGEILQAEISLIVPEKLRLRNISALECKNFADAVFLKQGRERQDFTVSGDRTISRNGVRCRLVELNGFFQVQKSGKFQPACRISCVVQDAAGGRRSSFFDDEFFGFSSGNRREMLVSAASDKELEVLTLPPEPQGVINLKLIGKWQISCRMPEQIKCGEVAEITLNISGNTPLVNFHTPEFEIPGARVYPPEVKRSGNSVTVKYLLVPLSEGKKELKLDFAVFDPETGKYNISHNNLKYTVLPGAVVTAPVQNTAAEKVSAEQDPVMAGKRELPFTPVARRKAVSMPLISGNLHWSIAVLLLSAVLLVIDFMVRHKRNADAADQQKNLQKRQLKKLISQIKKSADASAVLQQEGMTAIAAALGLPPGATAGEIADQIHDAELQKFFTDLAAAGFMPGAKVAENPALQNKLCRWLKTLMILLVVFLGAVPLYGKYHKEGNGAFEQGKYAEAKKFFSRSIDINAPDPAAYFNTGCAAAMLGEYPLATLRFEQALLLEPWNSEFRAAHRAVLEKLPGSAKNDDGSFGTFIISLRDRLRPDNYLFCASLMVLAIVIVHCLRSRMMKSYRITFQSIFAALLVLFVLAAYFQHSGTYSPERARIAASGAQLRTLPVQSSGEVITRLPAGTEVRIAERRPGWYRIIAPHHSGWIKQDEADGILPGKLF